MLPDNIQNCKIVREESIMKLKSYSDKGADNLIFYKEELRNSDTGKRGKN
jgi:hypothetical protein